MKQEYLILLCIVLLGAVGCTNSSATLSFTDFGAEPDTRENASIYAQKLISRLQERTDTNHVTVTFPKGTYHFYEDSAFVREYYT